MSSPIMPKTPSGYKFLSLPSMTPEQMSLFRERIGQSGRYGGQAVDYLGRLAAGDEGAYEQMEAPALRTYQQRLIPELAERFQQGGMLKSSAFAGAASEGAADLAERLAAQRAGIQQRSVESLLGLESSLLGARPYESFLQPKKKKWWESLLEGIAPAAGFARSFL